MLLNSTSVFQYPVPILNSRVFQTPHFSSAQLVFNGLTSLTAEGIRMLVHLQVGKFLTTGCDVGGRLLALPCLWRPISWHRRSRLVGIPLAMAVSGHGRSEEHYNVLAVSRFATFGDIKKAFRLLARKWHPDVNKDPQAGDVFKNVRLAYEVLSNEATRIQYDRELKSREGFSGSTGYTSYSPDLEDLIRIYTWTELRQKIRQKQHSKQYKNSRNRSFFYCELDEENGGKKSFGQRGSFMKALESAFISLFLMQTIGCGLSLAFSSLMALFDAKLDGGYKLAYVVAWYLGGKVGILLTLFLSFASWAFGKSSSGTVVVVLVAMWIGSTLASCCPIPQGAILALLHMSLKLQSDFN